MQFHVIHLEFAFPILFLKNSSPWFNIKMMILSKKLWKQRSETYIRQAQTNSCFGEWPLPTKLWEFFNTSEENLRSNQCHFFIAKLGSDSWNCYILVNICFLGIQLQSLAGCIAFLQAGSESHVTKFFPIRCK